MRRSRTTWVPDPYPHDLVVEILSPSRNGSELKEENLYPCVAEVGVPVISSTGLSGRAHPVSVRVTLCDVGPSGTGCYLVVVVVGGALTGPCFRCRRKGVLLGRAKRVSALGQRRRSPSSGSTSRGPAYPRTYTRVVGRAECLLVPPLLPVWARWATKPDSDLGGCGGSRVPPKVWVTCPCLEEDGPPATQTRRCVEKVLRARSRRETSRFARTKIVPGTYPSPTERTPPISFPGRWCSGAWDGTGRAGSGGHWRIQTHRGSHPNVLVCSSLR